jgi:hypothetical protein
MNICDLPIEIIYMIIEQTDCDDYINFILALGSYELFVATREDNALRAYLCSVEDEALTIIFGSDL